MYIHSIIHAPFEELGFIERWAQQQGHTLSLTHTYRGETLPGRLDYDALIVMGGPQSPLELDTYPYLEEEIRHIKRAIDADKKILGICLGAQLIAEALGAQTERSPDKEIGLFPVEVVDGGLTDPVFSQLAPSFMSMHWHQDMPGLPEGAVLLARSAACPRQAFRYRDRIYGFQFHLEMTSSSIAGMIAHCPGDLEMAPYVMGEQDLLAVDCQIINNHMQIFLEYWLNL